MSSCMADKPYTREEWLREKYLDEGLTQAEIAEQCGVSQGTVSHHINKNDIDTRTGGKWIGTETPDEPYTDSEWLREMYVGERKTAEEIAESQGVTATTIFRWLDEFDIPVRDQSEAQIRETKKVHDEEWLREQYVEERRSMRDIADEVGMTPSGVKGWVDRFGIETRDPHEHHQTEPAAHYWGPKGYEHISTRYHTETDGTTIHQLVAIAEGANPAKIFSNGRYHVHHENGVKWDNRPENLTVKSAKTHVVGHNHDDKHLASEEWVTNSDMEEALFELAGIVTDWRESDNPTLEMAADELDGLLREL